MNRLCPTSILCQLFPGEVDSPVLNVSAEAPDNIVFTGTGYTPFNPWRPTPLGDGLYFARDCHGMAFSVLSQEIADLIAQINAEACQQDSGGLRFSNSPQTASVQCASGGTFSYSVEAGMFISPLFPILSAGATAQEIADNEAAITAWIEGANARAFAYAQEQASGQLCCLTMRSGGICVGAPVLAGGVVFTAQTHVPAANFSMSVVSGTLPPGLTMVQTGTLEAQLTGTPTQVGTFAFQVQAVAGNASVTESFTLVISACGAPCTMAVDLPDATAESAYSEQLPAGPGTGPFTYTYDPATAPAWITSISSSGLITGTPAPADAGTTFTFDVVVTSSTGTSCTQQCEVDVQAALAPLAWWPMETWYDPANQLASIGGLTLSAISLGFLMSAISGKINFALRISCTGNTSLGSACTNSALSLSSSGITICLWVRITYNVTDAQNYSLVEYVFHEGVTVHTIDILRTGVGNWECKFDNATFISKPFSAGWHFLVLQYDPTTGALGFDIDQSGLLTSVLGGLVPTVHAGSGVVVGCGTQNLGDMFADFDELGVFNSILTTSQLDALYNSGAGVTY